MSMLANSGIPMIMLQMPAMLIALLPIIIIEGAIAQRLLRLPAKRTYGAVSAANVVSTIVGIPIAWVLMLGLELLTTGGGARGLGSPMSAFIAVVLQAAWLIPYESELFWMVPAASLVLLFPSFLMSVLIERAVLARMWKDVVRRRLKRVAWIINATSYGILFVIVGVWLGAELRKLPVATILVADETLWQAQDAGFPYRWILARAEKGDRQAIAALCRFSEHADAAGGLGHGLVLVELSDKVGDQQFADAVEWQTDEIKHSVARSLEAGAAYASNPELQRPPAERLPLTHAALSTHKGR